MEDVTTRVEDLQDIPNELVKSAEQLAASISSLKDPNILYQKCFQLLKLGGLEAEIPRLVVFGQQSMGKTTLLDFIMGGPIGYSSTDTGTRQPVVIMLKPSVNGKTEAVLKGKPLDIKDLQQAMKDLMVGRGEAISAEEVELEMSVPNGVHAVFVDLPGIKDDSKEGAELTRNVVRLYVRNNPNDLYVLVKKASDDPANWPWSLREFILSTPPRGLGLTTRQTIVVGTRSKDFLANEKNDVRSQDQLLERVKKRSVRDSEGNPLPLFLLELFSLSIEEKENPDFSARKAAMSRRIMLARADCMDLLSHGFEAASKASLKQELLRYFDVDLFKKELNAKFQSLLTNQLSLLERRLVRKRLDCQKQIVALEGQLSEQSPQSVREAIKLLLRELLQAVTELVTGNYMIMRLPGSGDAFLQEFGGNLDDNLKDGHSLAVELFPEKEFYDPEFLSKIQAHGEEMFRQALEKQKQMKEEYAVNGVVDPQIKSLVAEKPMPDVRGTFQPGQVVRFSLAKDDSQMIGFVNSMPNETTAESDSTPGNVTFFYAVDVDGGANKTYQTQSRQADRSRLFVVLPLTHLVTPSKIPPQGYRCWRRSLRSDGWMGLLPVCIQAIGQPITPMPNISPPPTQSQPGEPTTTTIHTGLATVSIQESKKPTGNSSEPSASQTNENVKFEDLFVDIGQIGEQLGGSHLSSENDEIWRQQSPLRQIAGDFAETKLLNQLSLTYLGRWLKFHIVNLEPDRRFSSHVLLQMMRSVRHVVDKADWEPLVADLLQANVRGGLLHLTRLAACSTAVALRRILMSAIHEIKRQVVTGDLSSALMFLAQNAQFMEELQAALEEFCRNRAQICSNAMRDLIFEQTHAIHFEMIQDFFDGCRQFETEFLGSNVMDQVSVRVREGLQQRKQRLGVADVYARQLTGGISQDMIYEEVRIQFWVVKMLLAAPLTTKLYMHFVKDIKDKSQHLASESKFQVTCESDLERSLQETLLCDRSPTGFPLPRSDEELMTHFNLTMNRDEIREKLSALRRVESYVKLALEGVARLRSEMAKAGGVDFLARLDMLRPTDPKGELLTTASPSTSPSSSLINSTVNMQLMSNYSHKPDSKTPIAPPPVTSSRRAS